MQGSPAKQLASSRVQVRTRLQQQGDRAGVPVPVGRPVKRGQSTLVPRVRVGASFQQYVQYREVRVTESRPVKGGAAVVVPCVRVGACRQQCGDNVQAFVGRSRPMKRSSVVSVACIRIGARFQQGGNGSRPFGQHGLMQWGDAKVLPQSRPRNGLYQGGGGGRVPSRHRNVHRRYPALVLRARIGTGFHQKVDDGGASGSFSRPVQGRPAPVVPRHRVGTGPKAFGYPRRRRRAKKSPRIPGIAFGGRLRGGTRRGLGLRSVPGFGRRGGAAGRPGARLRGRGRRPLLPGRLPHGADRFPGESSAGGQARVTQERRVGLRRARPPEPVDRPRLVAKLVHELLRLADRVRRRRRRGLNLRNVGGSGFRRLRIPRRGEPA